MTAWESISPPQAASLALSAFHAPIGSGLRGAGNATHRGLLELSARHWRTLVFCLGLPSGAFFQMDQANYGISANAIKTQIWTGHRAMNLVTLPGVANQAGFGIGPEAFYAVNMARVIRELLTVLHPEMLLIGATAIAWRASLAKASRH